MEKNIGPVNAIVLSRSGESDNVYTKNQQSIDANGLTEIKIVDNQIMNWNDRADYLDDLSSVLMNLEYYINDFSSTGILYYELADRYNVMIGQNSYTCIMFNDDVLRQDGLKEVIHTDMPEETETDYTKADKDDRKINRTYLIVDKQNQRIDAVIENVTEQNNKISQITQTVDELSSKISDIADITTSGETSYATLQVENINESEPIMIKVHPNLVNISYFYPNTGLFPGLDVFMKDRKILFHNETNNTDVYYTLPDDLLYYNQNVYDEFYLDFESQTCEVTKRCGYNADGTVYALQNEIVTSYPYPTIALDDGDYTISIPGYNYGYLFVRLVASNIYTSQFVTKVEMNSSINQKAGEIDLSVNEKLTNYSTTTQMNSSINQKANEITSTVASTYETKTNASQKYSQLQQTDQSIQTTVSKKVGNNEVISKINQSSEAVTINANKLGLNANNVLNILSGNTINLSSKNIAITSNNFSVDKNGKLNCSDATITGGKIRIAGGNNVDDLFRIESSQSYNTFSYIQPVGAGFVRGDTDRSVYIFVGDDSSSIWIQDYNGYTELSGRRVLTPYVEQTSLESEKKNFEKLEDALEIIKNIDIYKYNLKNENEKTKKHIGFVIGDNYNYSKEVTSNENRGVDLYSFISVCCKGIQEQQKQIEILEKEIEKLKEEK